MEGRDTRCGREGGRGHHGDRKWEQGIRPPFPPPLPLPPPLPHLQPLIRFRWGNNGGRKWRGGRPPTASINFITAHDGFTLPVPPSPPPLPSVQVGQQWRAQMAGWPAPDRLHQLHHRP